MTATPIRLALIGLGGMGLRHLAIFQDLAPWAQVTALADSHAPCLEHAAALVPSAAAFSDPHECVSHADVDGVVVATADATHPGIVAACIARGMPVLCEKPLTLSAGESLDLVRAERATGRRLVQVGHMRRYDTEYRALGDTLHSGRIGEPVLIRQRHHNPLAVNNFNAQELITSSAAHDIDLFRWLTGNEVGEVSCTTKTIADTVIVVMTLTSRSGVLGVMELGRGPGMQYDIGLAVVASHGSLLLGSPTQTTCSAADGLAARRLPASWLERFDSAYRAQDAAWLTAVARNAVNGPSAYDGYAVNVVTDAALAALTTGTAQAVAQLL